MCVCLLNVDRGRKSSAASPSSLPQSPIRSMRRSAATLVLLGAIRLHAAAIAQPCACLDCDCAAVLQPAAVGPHTVEDEDPDQCAVVIASNFDRRLELFSLGDDGQAYHKAQHADGAGWGSWAELANTPAHDGGLAVVRAADRLIAAVCGTDGSIHLAAQAEPNGATDKWTAWRPVGGPPGGCKHTPSLVLDGAVACVRRLPWPCPSYAASAADQDAPGGTGRLDTHKGRYPAPWSCNLRLACSSQPAGPKVLNPRPVTLRHCGAVGPPGAAAATAQGCDPVQLGRCNSSPVHSAFQARRRCTSSRPTHGGGSSG